MRAEQVYMMDKSIDSESDVSKGRELIKASEQWLKWAPKGKFTSSLSLEAEESLTEEAQSERVPLEW